MTSCPNMTSMSDKDILACDKLNGELSALRRQQTCMYLHMYVNLIDTGSYISSLYVTILKIRSPFTITQPENLCTSPGRNCASTPLQATYIHNNLKVILN